MILNSLRNKTFWLIDSIKKGETKTHLKEIEFCIDNPNNKTTKQIRKDHLEKILSHATNTVLFYKSLGNTKDILDFPVIRKTVIQADFESFQSNIFKNKDNFKVSTSGSTGVPFFLFQNQEKRKRNNADVIYFLKKSGYEIGNRLYHLGIWTKHNSKNKLESWIYNKSQIDISRFSDQRIKSFIALLKTDTQSKKTILGIASAFEMIAKYLKDSNITLSDSGITAAIANSEYLNPFTKTNLGKHLNTKVLSRYSSEELGIIAQQTLNSPDKFVINDASYFVEILNLENDNPVKIGEFGRIIVTDLFNYAMPLIRYDTGDIAQLGANDDGTFRLDQVEGRKMDIIYDSSGNLVSSYLVFTKVFKYYTLFKQYQFIQQGEKDYEIKLNLHGDNFEHENELIENVKSDFGEDATVTITYVDGIPPLSSGKRRKVVNNYKK